MKQSVGIPASRQSPRQSNLSDRWHTCEDTSDVSSRALIVSILPDTDPALYSLEWRSRTNSYLIPVSCADLTARCFFASAIQVLSKFSELDESNRDFTYHNRAAQRRVGMARTVVEVDKRHIRSARLSRSAPDAAQREEQNRKASNR